MRPCCNAVLSSGTAFAVTPENTASTMAWCTKTFMRSSSPGSVQEVVEGNGSGGNPGNDGRPIGRVPILAAYSSADTDRAVTFSYTWYYAYVRIPHDGAVNMARLGVNANAEYVDDVTVVFVAIPPAGGSVVVGWYRHARVWRRPQERMNRRYQYIAEAKVETCTLLEVDERTISVPRAGPDVEWEAAPQRNRRVRRLACPNASTHRPVTASSRRSAVTVRAWLSAAAVGA